MHFQTPTVPSISVVEIDDEPLIVPERDATEPADPATPPPTTPQHSAKRPAESPASQPKRLKTQSTMFSHVKRTNQSDKERCDNAIMKFWAACRIPFNAAENDAFKAMISVLRPGYEPPTSRALSGKLLDNLHDQLHENMGQQLKDKPVCLQQDGWSDVHQHPVVATCINVEGKALLHDAEESGTATKNAEYYKTKITASITAAE